jgi:tetratricopeptide (TPR) repeat protein
MPHHFICYSTVDALDFALRLHEELTAGPPPFEVWLDKHRLRPGFDWDSQLVEALRLSETLLFLMSPDSVEDGSPCKEEWTRALVYRKPVVPILLNSQIEIPFGLGRRQHIDFTCDFKEPLAQLRQHLIWLASREGQLQCLRYQLQDSKRRFAHAASELQRQRITAEIEGLQAQIRDLEQVIARPEDAERRVDESIQRGLELQREQPNRPAERPQRARFVNRPPGVAPTYFQDRVVETQLLARFLKDQAIRIVTVVGPGGVGKTAIVCRLLDALQRGCLPDSDESIDVDGIVYLSATGSRRISFSTLFEDLCQMLPPEQLPALDSIYKSAYSTAVKMGALLDRFPSGCYVVLLDNFEDLVDLQTERVLDAELDAALRALLTHQPNGVKVLITTRVRPVDLLVVGPGRQGVLTLDEGLESRYGVKVLREMDGHNAVGLRDAPDATLTKLCESVRGYPRALEAVHAILAASPATTLENLVADAEHLPENVVEILVGEAFNRLDRNAEEVMEALAIFGNPVPPTAVDYLLQPFSPGVDSAPILRRLANMHFVRREHDRYYLHPVDKKYAMSRIPVGGEADRITADPVFSRFALCDRAGDYYCEVRKPRAEWRTIQDLEPQLSEFDLRVEGGDRETALRILSDLADDYLIRWGHYSLCIEMAERLGPRFIEPRDELSRVQILASAHGFGGGLQRAAALWQEAIKVADETADDFAKWRATGNLAGCRDSLGDYKGAIKTFRRVLRYACRHSYSQWEGTSHSRIGLSFRSLGKIRYAINHLKKSLHNAQERRDAHGEEGDWHNLGNCYYDLGEIAKAREHYEKALKLSTKSGDRSWRANHFGGLGDCSLIVGDISRAESCYNEALNLRREIGHRRNEAASLSCLAECAAQRGDTMRALAGSRDAMVIAMEFDSVVDIQNFRENIAMLLVDSGEINDAIREAKSALELGKRFQIPLARANAGLALAALIGGAIDVAHAAADEALKYDVPLENSLSAAIRGLVAFRESDMAAARASFANAVVEANKLLTRTPELFGQLDIKGLGLSGMALCGSSRHIAEAEDAYRAARLINRDPGTVARVLRLLDQLAMADKDRLLGNVQSAAAGVTDIMRRENLD